MFLIKIWVKIKKISLGEDKFSESQIVKIFGYSNYKMQNFPKNVQILIPRQIEHIHQKLTKCLWNSFW